MSYVVKWVDGGVSYLRRIDVASGLRFANWSGWQRGAMRFASKAEAKEYIRGLWGPQHVRFVRLVKKKQEAA